MPMYEPMQPERGDAPPFPQRSGPPGPVGGGSPMPPGGVPPQAQGGAQQLDPAIAQHINPNDPEQMDLLRQIDQLTPQEVMAVENLPPRVIAILKMAAPKIKFLLDMIGQQDGPGPGQMPPGGAPRPMPSDGPMPPPAMPQTRLARM